jgi:hypothetical protein
VDIGAFEVQPPTVSVTASVSAPAYGQAVTFTATLSYLGSPVTAGTVTFQEGTTVLASGVALNSSGQATATTSSLSAAAHTLRAVYSGGPGFFASSGSTSLTIAQAPLSVRVVHGVLYNGDPTLRQQAADLFDALNQAGD